MAKITTINVQRTYNTGNYSSIRLGGDFEIEEGETLEAAMAYANATIAQMYQQAQAETTAPAAKPIPPTKPVGVQIQPPTVPGVPTMPAAPKIHLVADDNEEEWQKLKKRIALANTGAISKKTGKPFARVTMKDIESAYSFDEKTRKILSVELAIN